MCLWSWLLGHGLYRNIQPFLTTNTGQEVVVLSVVLSNVCLEVGFLLDYLSGLSNTACIPGK